MQIIRLSDRSEGLLFTALCGATAAHAEMCRVHLFCRDSRPYKVGYSSITVEPGFHLFTATFEDVAGNEYKLNDIKILNEDGTPWDVKDSTGSACVIQKMTTDGKGAYDSTKLYTYRHYYKAPPPRETDNGLGWYVGSSISARVTDDITIEAGEGVSINNKTEADVIVVFPSPIAPKETLAE